MAKKVILSINAGSSSVKVSVFSAAQGTTSVPTQLAEIQLSGLTSPPCAVKYTRGATNVFKDKEVSNGGNSKDSTGKGIQNQQDAFRYLLDTLVQDEQLAEIGSAADIDIACHRVVHGGDYTAPQTITADTYHHLEELTDLAPLHNSSALAIVKLCMSGTGDQGSKVGNSDEKDEEGKSQQRLLLPRATNVACFDSQFHATIPTHISTYPIKPEIAKNNGLRKYGFHGISYQFITESVAEFLGKPVGETSIIALHLGSGASACAVRKGKSLDTSMGLTPLAGLPGATRSGSVDPSLVFHYASDVGKMSPSSTGELHISRAEEILNKESGWKALTGTTNFGEIASSEDPRHRLAFDLFVDRVCGFVGSYYVALRGEVDALVFAGGIGEKSARLRREVVERAACLGFRIDGKRNEAEVDGKDVVVEIGRGEGRTHRTLICMTDEQLQMAKQCAAMEELWR
ncbi:Acetokinase family-domain-containing protein [Microdochium trichocladiopsis]|uniref:Probable acetate kinase n=1 Tax=Microdochium trichocladiopsis TaxID=1682393 RepID=A0A9P9BMX0_9PEZI|nr:Acetokinase family-domain-containing protein [Microdochium trichocladiopsis]KAH7026336.1 Acetokinase family-domain-containing protein [Microdochium trichocladiopsis]